MRFAASRVVCMLVLAAAGGCRTHPPPPVPVPPPPDDSAADWHGLILAPFGSALKDVPAPLHEVLLFRDDARDGAAVDAECYSTDSAAPPLLGRTPDDYLICFKHDRLSRIQASVHLTAAEASDVFAQACGAWLRHAATSGSAAAAPAGTASGAASPGSDCEGRDGAVHFVGHLAEEPDAEDGSEHTLSLRLDSPDQ